VWDEQTLDALIAGPTALIPGIQMRFPGVPDAQKRQDLIAYLKSVANPP
jgi:cytochrome c